MAILYGQNLRVLVGTTCVSQATNCQITLNTNTEETSTKDDVGLSSRPTVTSKSWQIQVDSLDISDLGTLLTAIKSKNLFDVIFNETSPSDNRSPVTNNYGRRGNAYLSDINITFNDREWSAKNATFTGSGELMSVN